MLHLSTYKLEDKIISIYDRLKEKNFDSFCSFFVIFVLDTCLYNTFTRAVSGGVNYGHSMQIKRMPTCLILLQVSSGRVTVYL